MEKILEKIKERWVQLLLVILLAVEFATNDKNSALMSNEITAFGLSVAIAVAHTNAKKGSIPTFLLTWLVTMIILSFLFGLVITIMTATGHIIDISNWVSFIATVIGILL